MAIEKTVYVCVEENEQILFTRKELDGEDFWNDENSDSVILAVYELKGYVTVSRPTVSVSVIRKTPK